MTPEEISEVLAEALDRHKTTTPVAYKVDRGRLLDGRPFLAVSLPGGKCVRITLEEEDWA